MSALRSVHVLVGGVVRIMVLGKAARSSPVTFAHSSLTAVVGAFGQEHKQRHFRWLYYPSVSPQSDTEPLQLVTLLNGRIFRTLHFSLCGKIYSEMKLDG